MMKFSIIIPVYNSLEFLKETLDTCFAQTYKDYDIYVIDDGSPFPIQDSVRQITENASFEGTLFNIRIDNVGAAAARNYAVSLSDSDYLVFLDADDKLHPDALFNYEKIISKTKCRLICPKRYEFNVNLSNELLGGFTEYDLKYYYFKSYLNNQINFRFGASNIVVARIDFLQVDGFRLRTERTWHCEDHDLLLKLANTPGFVFVEAPYLVFYRLHDNNSIHSISKIAYGVIDIIKSNESGKYDGRKTNKRQINEIIGTTVFHCLKRLLKRKEFALFFELLKEGHIYILYYIGSKIKIDGKRASV